MMDEITALLPGLLLHSPTYFLAVSNHEGSCVFANETFKKRFSLSTGNFEGITLQNAVHPDYFDQCTQALTHCLANPEAVESLQMRKTDKAGGGWAQWNFSAFRNGSGNIVGVCCLGHDLDDNENTSHNPKVLINRVAIAMDNMEDGLFILDRDWRFEKVNRAAEETLGKTAQEMLGKNIWQVFPGTDGYAHVAQFRRAMDECVTVHFEEYRPDLQRWLTLVGYPCIEGITVFLKDTTARHQAQEQLLHSENKLRAILNSTTDSNVLIDPDFRILSFNEMARANMLHFFGRQVYEGDDFRNYLIQEIEETFYQAFAKALQGEKTELEWQLNFETFKVWFRFGYYPVYDGSDRIIGVSFNSTDIDEKKNAQQELRNSEHILAAIYNSTNDASCFVSPGRKILYFNKVAYEMMKARYGMPPKIGDDFSSYLIPELQEEHREHFKRALHGETIQVERSDGQDWYVFSIFPVYDSQGTLVGVAENANNITKSKQNELRVQVQNEKLRAIMWQQCHEVRRPVANILGLAQLLKTDGETNGQYDEIHLQYLLQTTEELDAIIHRIVSQTLESGLPNH